MAPYGSNSPTTDMSSTQVPGLTLDWGAGGNDSSERVWIPNTPSSNDPESCVAELQELLQGHFRRRLNGSQPKPFQGTHLPPTNSEQTTATPETPVNLTKWTLTPTTTTTAATRLAQARIASPLGFAGITAESSPQVPRIHNLVAPRRPPTWTSAPLIPVASLASPRLQNAPFEDSGPLRSPWPVPAAIDSGPSRNPGIFGSVNQAGYPNIASALPETQHNGLPAGQTSVMGGFHPQQTQTAMSTPFPAAGGTPENPWTAHQSPEMANNQTSFFGQRFPGFIPTQAALQRGVSPGGRINGLGPLSPPPSYYFPMNCRTEVERKRTRTHKEAMELMLKGFSPNYRGDPDLARNKSADIPPDQNCSLFLVGLAPNLTTHELLAGIRDCGRVYATHINPPAPEKGHAFSAAKLVFFERKSAERFYNRFAATGYFTPNYPHLRARVTWNRVRSAEEDPNGRRSRVLLISGPRHLVEPRAMCTYLDTKMVYQLDDIIHLGTSRDGNRILLEYRFGSFRCQAEAARMALMREYRDLGVMCEYGLDPCDRIQPEEDNGVFGSPVPLSAGTR